MHATGFLEETDLPSLGLGAGMLVWGFRASAAGRSACPCVVQGFAHRFGASGGEDVREALLSLTSHIGCEGRRKVRIAMSGCLRLTHDEASLVSALGAAQSADSALRDAHLSWLLAMPASREASTLADRLASAFTVAALSINPPWRTARSARPHWPSLAQMQTLGTA